MGILHWLGALLRGGQGQPALACPSGLASRVGEPDLNENKEKAMSITSSGQAYHNNLVGPVMRAGDLAMAVIEAAKVDNPGKEVFVDDKRAYLRIDTDDEMILRRETIEIALGRPFKMNDLEVDLSSFAGRIETLPDQVRFYFTKHI